MDIKLYRNTYLFYFMAIIIPWSLWFYAAYLSRAYPGQNAILIGVICFLGLLAPMAIAILLILPHQQLRKDFTSRVLNLKGINSKYLSITFLLMPFSILIAQLISMLFGYSIEQFQFRDSYTFTSGIFPVWFVLIVAPIVEELAWHSYGTDCLRSRLNLLNTSLAFAFFWGVWHFPLSFIKDYYHSNLVEDGIIYAINFFVSLFPFVIIMNWLYYKANRNIMIAIIFHISAGFFNEIFATDPMSKVIQTGLLILVSGYLIFNDKAFFSNI